MVCVEPAVEVAEDDNEDEVIEAAEAPELRLLRLFWESTSNVSSTSSIEVDAMDWLGSNLDKVQALPLMEAAEASLMPTSGFTEARGCSSIKLASTITMDTEAVELSLLLSSLPDFKVQQQQHSLIILNEILPKATN